MNSRTLAQGLGYFSVALGLVEVVWPGRLAKALGLEGKEGLVRFYGARELGAGAGLLLTDAQRPWVLARIGGDALDIATLAVGLKSQKRANAAAALAMVLGVTALDILCAKGLSEE
ncbi:hypothetical protein [Deinococcus yavapaiensis]|uniref:Uncharacterized protein n=1 Tax=Deinococcus yavapaiensis KR-236 TaxID=694435 RepID=A0A318S7F0_9DEIO|nr:hypothetical protein [Deinococcus yavapaiensis]PYE53647.1 hypothetical protein DES52_108178 [Deinococcus yavapaiensis KR-236]